MKKLFKILILFILALIVVLCCSCEKQDKGAISVVCTGFAEYDWAKNVIGEGNDSITLIYLLEDGSDAHSFQPSISDIAKVSECDLFIYSGGSSYSWCEEIVKSANNKSMATLCIYSLFEDELISSSNSSCCTGACDAQELPCVKGKRSASVLCPSSPYTGEASVQCVTVR